jgi:hypothetical protein
MSHRSELPPEHLVAELVGVLDDALEMDDPADLELLAGTLLLPISIPEVPEPARRVVIDAIESSVRRHAGAVGGGMLHWRAAIGDGHLGRWEVEDLATFLIEHVSSSSELDDDERTAAPDCALAMIRFLADRGSLSGDPLPDLEHACEMLRAHVAAHRPRGNTPSQRRAKRNGQRARRAVVAERTRAVARGARSVTAHHLGHRDGRTGRTTSASPSRRHRARSPPGRCRGARAHPVRRAWQAPAHELGSRDGGELHHE